MSKIEVKVSLKIMVDAKTKKVIFAEAGKDFVDFIVHLLSLPLATVVKLLDENKAAMPGSLQDLYKSIQSLNDDYFATDTEKSSVLVPKTAVVIPLLSPNVPVYCHMNVKKALIYVPKISAKGTPEYVKELVTYIVMDNLEVKPMSVNLIRSLVHGVTSLEEKEVQLGHKEGVALLKASLVTKSVLTTVFLGTNKKMKVERT